MDHRRTTTIARRGARLAAGLGLCLAALASAAQPASSPSGATWPMAGRQGIIEVVIVPVADAANREAYLQQIPLLCEPQRTCFVNFYTNSTGAPLALPLPEAIEHEAAAVYRRSTKQGGEFIRFACRLKIDVDGCF
jgi:hypothetical protein